jgi:chaperonin GroES
MSKFKPIGDRILVEPAMTEEKNGRIFIPDAAKEKPQEAIVMALGTGRILDDGAKQPFPMKVGDRVLVKKYGGAEIKLDGKEFKVVETDDILAIIEK